MGGRCVPATPPTYVLVNLSRGSYIDIDTELDDVDASATVASASEHAMVAFRRKHLLSGARYGGLPEEAFAASGARLEGGGWERAGRTTARLSCGTSTPLVACL